MTTKTDPRRAQLIKLIHVARRELQMDEPTYRTVLQSAGKSESLSAMNVPAMEAVLKHLKKSGFKVRVKGKSRPLSTHPSDSKARALWLFLHELGVVRDPSEAALARYVRRIGGTDDLRWNRGYRRVDSGTNPGFKDRTELVIESLKAWAMRFLPGKVKELALRAQGLPLTMLEKEHLNGALVHAFAHNTFDFMHTAWEGLTAAINKER